MHVTRGRPEYNPKPMSLTAIEDLITQHVADNHANLEANRNIDSGVNEGESLHKCNRGPNTSCSYKDFINCKPRSFH